ncbi:MAG: prepilin peptidase [Planctomycetaceae bacterium]|nr:prepilin peptidase [Planctomycetaceae bacterium]
MKFPWIDLPWLPVFVAFLMTGAISGYAITRWAEQLLLSHLPSWRKSGKWKTRVTASLGTAGLFGLYLWVVCGLQSQSIPEVRPSEFGRFCQILFHLSLIAILIGITMTDLWDYAVMDQMILVGLIIGLGGQFLSGEVQIQHLWIDWNAEQIGLKGPDFPLWIDRYRHFHGLAVGLAGMFAGAGITWLVRAVSSKLLGQETMGSGDVTLMAVIGSFLGWQPVLFVFALAPLTGVAISLISRMLGGKSYVPYGPFLALASYIVLCAWAPLWTPLRYVFGHPPTVAGVIGGAGAAFVLLITLLKLYRSIPISDSQRYTSSAVMEETQAVKED